MFHKRETRIGGRSARPRYRSSMGKTAMKSVTTNASPSRPALSGPAAAVLVALAGAALVAIGLILVGTRDTRISQWTPPAVPAPIGATAS